MFENRVTHHTLLAVAAAFTGVGILLLTAGLFTLYLSETGSRLPLIEGAGGALCVFIGMGVASYIKRRMRT